MAGVDRISQLPDDIINHILSFLPTTKLRARTSLLSKRWRHIWTHHPSLHFSLRNPFFLPSSDRPSIGVWAATVIDYGCAVLSCFKSYKAPVLQQFFVDLWLPPHPTPAERVLHVFAVMWLHLAGLHSVRELRLRAMKHPSRCDGKHPTIPASLFHCHLLTDLKISFGAFPNIPSDFHGFRFLKALSLDRASISNDALNFLLAGCPDLSSLSVVECSVLTDINVNIKAPNLTDLFLYADEDLTAVSIEAPNLTDLFLYVDEDLTAVSIEAPNLRSIAHQGDLQCLDLKSSPVLHEAILRWDYANKFGTKDAFMRVLFAISAANVLTANDWFYEFAITEPAVFNNLKELDLYFGIKITESALEALITSIGGCRMLEKLSINLNWAMLEYGYVPTEVVKAKLEQDRCDPPENLGGQSLGNLKTVTVRDFLEFKSVMWLVKFLLGSAAALEKFVVFDFLNRDEEELWEMFAPIPKASAQVKLSLLDNKSRGVFQQKYFGIFRERWTLEDD